MLDPEVWKELAGELQWLSPSTLADLPELPSSYEGEDEALLEAA